MEKLDAYDKKILRILQNQGKISNQDLADQANLAPSSCLRRVKALEERGIIKGYRAMLNADEVDFGLTALIHITMTKHTPEQLASFERAVKAIPQVLECLLITGHQADYMLRVVAKDLTEYQHLLLQKITGISGVSGVHTSFVLNKVVDKTALPI
jgi:Lrp/AsnC family leucine-responsive transcriptional regulator